MGLFEIQVKFKPKARRESPGTGCDPFMIYPLFVVFDHNTEVSEMK